MSGKRRSIPNPGHAPPPIDKRSENPAIPNSVCRSESSSRRPIRPSRIRSPLQTTRLDMADGAAPDGDHQAPSSGPRGDGNRSRGRGRGGGGRGRGRGDHSRGRGRGGGGRGGGGAGHHHGGNTATSDPASQEPKKAPNFKNKVEAPDAEGDDNAETCFICANPITHFSVAPCNHTTCHICSLRLRALYKSKDCPHCRTSSPYVIFTDDGTKRFEDYTNQDITSTDDNIGIKYAGEEIVGDTILLLRFNCPDAECDFAGLGWQDLHQHVRHVHHMKMCDLCTRNKKVFTHEHELFADKQLTEHMRHGDDKPGAADQTGFRGHPLCGFCGARFYDSDKLYEHCRNKHERCFLCDRRDSRQPHYFLDYDALEQHFKKDHFLCNDRECLEKKFVVFESEMDLKAHQLSEHGGSVGTGRDARRVDMSNFDLRQRYEQERGAPRGGRNPERRRAPDPANEPIPVSSAQPLRRDEIAFQRQMAIQSGAASRAPPAPAPGPSRPPPPAVAASRAATAAAAVAASQPIDAMENLSITDWSSLTQEQRASLARHNAVVERASNLLGNNENKIATFRQYISNYNRGSMNPTQLIDAFASLFAETSSDTALGTLVREVAELFEDKKKGDALRAAWQNRRLRAQDREEEYPSLPGLGGMHGATTSTTGWATAAAPTRVTLHNNGAAQQERNSNRVLKLKNSTRRGSISNSSVMSFASASSGNVAGPSRTITASPAAFPALPSAARPTPAQSSQPSWIGGGNSTPTATSAPRITTASHVGTGARRGPPPQTSSSDAFPALPAAPKPKTTIFGYGRGVVRRDFGVRSDTGFSWGGGAGGSGSGAAAGPGEEQQQQQQEGQGPGGNNKGKKNKKQVLAHWG
ncbi:putative zinc finger protein [Triangularia setosa]|uniref:RING-type E3 ubiquitin transferase n=1 Tax=Triangularia setosa TaxID=2587417 RepID=A0AAN6VZN6_9PEZI|nr:putative zinc finger protein [Podospora setosa]